MMPYTWKMALMGGIMIGLASMLLFWLNGRVAGNSGIIAQSFPSRKNGWWRLMYVLGLLCGGVLYRLYWVNQEGLHYSSSMMTLVIAGLFVGIGTRLGSGCTSGHGVCGIGRLSLRSVVATGVFMVSAAVTVWVVRLLGGVWW